MTNTQPKCGALFFVSHFTHLFYGDGCDSDCVLLRRFCDTDRVPICNSYNAGALQVLQILPVIAGLSVTLLGVWVVLVGREQITLLV